MMIIKNDNNNDNNNNMNTKTTKTKQILLMLYITSSILMLTFSIFSVQTSRAQVINENNTNNVPITNTNKISDTTTSTSFTSDSKKLMHVPNQIVVVAEDIEEIRDNLQEAREALNNANYLQVLSHINNIDLLLTAFVVNESPTFVDNKNNNTTPNSNYDSTALASSNADSMLNENNNKLITIKGENDELKINEQLFTPNNLTISKGNSIIWLNKDNLPHTITLKKLDEQQTQEFKFALSLGDSYKYTFDEAGVYGFYSDRSKWSEGKITVS
jgi:plastocyanin